MDDGLKVRSANKRINSFYGSLVNVFKGKYVRTMLLAFIAGLIVALIPTLIYINSMKEDTLVFQFVPNVTAYKKPTYVQILKTPEEVDIVKKSNIRDASRATLGSSVQIGSIGLTLVPKAEMDTPTYHFKEIVPQKNKQKTLDGYLWIPNAIFTKDPIPLQVLNIQNSVEMAKNVNWLSNKDLLEVGAAISCTNDDCFTMAKSTLAREYEKVIPLDTQEV